MSNFALVSTVDTMGEEFPGYRNCVIVFDSEKDAILFAAKTIVKHDESTAHLESLGKWFIAGYNVFDDPEDFLDAWQTGLDSTEYFHVMPVKSEA
jgi:hypothetical protein